MTTENPTPTTENDSAAKTAVRPRSTAKKDEVVALSVKEPTALGWRGNRPIEPSHLNVMHTYKSGGAERPVTAGLMEVSGTMSISGNRPIMASHLQISETIVLMGNRPVASNETEDMDILIGYLD